MKYHLLAFFLLLSVCFFSQTYRFDNYNNQDGLAQSQANCMLQDHLGYMWFGTVGGLSKFDSHGFTNYFKKDGLLDDNITSLFEDEKKQVWVGMEGGISKKNGEIFESFSFPKEYSQYKVLDINSIHSDTLLLATNGCGIIKFILSNLSFEVNPTDKYYIRKLYIDGDRALMATPEGLFVSSTKDISNRSIFHPDFENVSITDFEKLGGDLWVSSYKKGVFKFRNDVVKNYTETDGLITSSIRNIEVDNEGKIWFASNSGISCFQEGIFLNMTEKNGLSNSNIQETLRDKNGSMWLASKGKGIFRFSGWLFTTLTQKDKIPSSIIMTLAKDQEGNLWYGSYDEGIAYKNKLDSIVSVPELGSSPTWSSLVARDGKVWFGTNRGIKIYDHGEIIDPNKEELFNGKRVTALYEDKEGVIWIGHRDGLSSYDGSEFKNYAVQLGVPIKRIRSIVESNGSLWLGGENGLFSFDGNIFSHYNEDHGLSDNDVNTLTVDTYDRIWIGTRNGLNILENDKIKSVTFNSKPNDPVNFLQEVGGMMLIGSNNGLHVKKNKSESDKENPSLYHFNLSSGLPNLECNLNAVKQVSESEIYFGTSDGLVNMNVEMFTKIGPTSAPDVHINGIRIFMLNKDLTDFSEGLNLKTGLPKDLQLRPSDNHVTFDFTGISYNSSKDVSYKYRLIGADADWLPPTKSDFATYSYLPHGDYTMEVIASDLNSEWSSNPQTYSFSILAPYYLKTWFIALCALFGASLVYMIYRWRQNVAKKKNETELIVMQSKLMDLEQQSLNSSMNRHFIFNALNSIQYYINREDKRAANTYLTNFAKLIRKNLDSTENNWTSLQEELERIELYLSMEHMRFKDRFEYKINISKDIDVNQIEIPPMLFQPFLENSIWHGILPKETKGEVCLNISRENDAVKITIEDNGIGLNQSKVNKNGQVGHDSKGVDIINSRIKLFSKMTDKAFKINGPRDLHDENNECTGTIVEIYMPVVKSIQYN